MGMEHEVIEENELVMAAMDILVHAGDAREMTKKALEAVQQQDFEEARRQMAEAKKNITTAHQAQTEIIQNEARGIKYEYCMLFNHAQDTLMTINSEVILTQTLIDTFQVYTNMLLNKGESQK